MGDSTEYYYQLAYDNLPDTTGITYRDLKAGLLFLSYTRGSAVDTILIQLKHLFSYSESEKEYLSRCLTIGEVYYLENIPDSALLYLIKVYESSNSIDAKKQSAQWLAEICKSLGKDAEFIEYASFLVPFANQEENKSEVKSYLTEYYNTFCQNTIERKHQSVIKEQTKRIVWILAGLLVVIIILSILYHSRKKQVGVLTKQMDKEQSGINKRNSLETFLNEPLCQDIILSVQGKNIKRSTLPQDYQELILLDSQLQQLTLLVNRYFNSFDRKLKKFGISNTSMANLCHLYLLGMDEKQAAILLNKDYSTVKRYEKSLKTTFNTQEDLVVFMRNLVLCD